MILGAIIVRCLQPSVYSARTDKCGLVELRAVDRQLRAGHDIIRVFGDVGHVVADALQILRAEQEMRAGRDVARVFHHVGEQFAKHRRVFHVDLLVVHAQRPQAFGVAGQIAFDHAVHLFEHHARPSHRCRATGCAAWLPRRRH